MEILNYCDLKDNGTRLIVPSPKTYPISKADYAAFKKQMLNIKGVWEGNRTFSFPYNAGGIIEKIKVGNSYDFRKLQLFPTPRFLARNMWDRLCYEFGLPYHHERNVRNLKILEPSAGTGSLINFLHCAGAENVDYCEISEEYEQILQSNALGKKTKVGGDFLKLEGYGCQYDLVFANPPFNSGTKHLNKMWKVLKKGGYICTLLGEGFFEKNEKDDFEGFQKKYSSEFYCEQHKRSDSKDKGDWIFEDTPSGYSLLIVRKPPEPQFSLFGA